MVATYPTIHTCSCKTTATSNDLNYPQAIKIDMTHPDADTSVTTSDNIAVSSQITSGGDYLLVRAKQCFDMFGGSDSIKGIITLSGIPRLIRQNSSGPFTTPAHGGGADRDKTIIRSVDAFLEIFLAYGDSAQFDSSNIELRGKYYCGYGDSLESGRWLPVFQSGAYWNKSLTTVSDSIQQLVVVTRLDGMHEDDVLGLIAKSQNISAFNADGTTDKWIVVDALADGSRSGGYPHNPFSTLASKGNASLFFYDALSIFGYDKMLFDTRDTLFAVTVGDTLIGHPTLNPDTCSTYFGYGGGQTLSAGDSAIMYLTPAYYHGSGIPANIMYEANVPLANGAFMTTQESFNCWTIRDTSLRSGSGTTQSMVGEWIDRDGMDATFACGNAEEVSVSVVAGTAYWTPTNGNTNGVRVLSKMFAPYASFSDVKSYGVQMLQMTVAIGNPLGYWRPALTAANEAANFSGNCSEILSYSGVMPGSADSLNFWIATETDTVDTTFVVTPSAEATFNFGTRWVSYGISECVVSIIDTQGYYHSSEFIAP